MLYEVITSLASGGTGASTNPLAPVTGLLNTVTGTLSGATSSTGGSTGLLAPVTGSLGTLGSFGK